MTLSPYRLHALVLPDNDFNNWYRAAEAYTQAFAPVTVVRSPRGADLNRYYAVTGVQAPAVWFNNDAIAHLRRVYPTVVRADRVIASTPDDLRAALATRIARRDRFDEAGAADGHLRDRFVVGWPTPDAFPARILTPFSAWVGTSPTVGRKDEAITVTAAAGAAVVAPVDGTIEAVGRVPVLEGLGYGSVVVQINVPITPMSEVRAVQRVIVGNLGTTTVQLGQIVKAGDPIGTAAGVTLRIAVQRVGGGLAGFALPDVIDPLPAISWFEMRLRATDNGLRIRQKDGVQYDILGRVNTGDALETMETHGRTLLKVSKLGEWIKVRSRIAPEGYGAAWFLEAVPPLAFRDLTGVNLDFLHPRGKPAPSRLAGIPMIRVAYKAVPSQGFPTLDAAHAFYDPLLRAYRAAGLSIVVVLTHQTFGEGAGYDWPSMYADQRGRWDDFIPRYAAVVGAIAARYRGLGLTYQVWNEQDTNPQAARAAVPIQPADYAKLITAAIRAVRGADTGARVITGGHIAGPGTGAAYARATIAAMPGDVRPDALACHSYGRGAPGADPTYAPFGNVDDDINTYEAILPGRPVWITEWGVLDRPNAPMADVSRYATGFVNHIKDQYQRKTAAAMWYAWADGMDNGFGLVDANDQAKPLLAAYAGL